MGHERFTVLGIRETHWLISPITTVVKSGKEEQQLFGLHFTDFGYRMYDGELVRWWSVDRMAAKYYPWSPYNYTLNNPIRYTDPNGLWVDGYVVDKKGYTHWVNNAGGKEYDVMFKNDDYRAGKDSAEDGVRVGKLPSTQHRMHRRAGGEIIGILDYSTTANADDAAAMFEFMSDNTDVEWSNRELSTDEGETINIVSTSHQEGTVRGINELMGQKYYKFRNVIRMDHSHPNGSTSRASDSDREGARLWKKDSPDAKFRIRFEGRYYEYDEDGNKR